jgi:hypothetical protein
MSLLLAVQKDHSAPVHGILHLEESKLLKPDSFYDLVQGFCKLESFFLSPSPQQLLLSNSYSAQVLCMA